MGEFPESRYAHRTPVEPRPEGSWEPAPAGDSVEEALQAVLRQFAGHFHALSSLLFERSGGLDSTVLLFRVSPGYILPVGVSELAEQVRNLLDAGFGGWHRFQLPETRTPIKTLRQRLNSRYYNILDRNNFATVEEVAAVPAAAWLELRHAGPKFLAALDLALERYSPDAVEVARPGSAEAVAERRVHLAKRLGPPARLRYAQFLEQLARSRIPILALDKISDALDAEAIPIADPTVTLLLDTAGEEELLGFYLQTHAPAVEDPSASGNGGPGARVSD